MKACTLCRYLETLWTAPWRAAVSGSSKKGFTLIELLVVVLIIGILASVALPQYTKAVAKTRMMTYLQMAQGIRHAQELYYVANNTYATRLNDLEIDYSNVCPYLGTDTGILLCPFAHVDNIIGLDVTPTASLVKMAFYSSGYSYGAGQTPDLHLDVWFEHSDHPNQITCTGYTDLGRYLCKSLFPGE